MFKIHDFVFNKLKSFFEYCIEILLSTRLGKKIFLQWFMWNRVRPLILIIVSFARILVFVGFSYKFDFVFFLLGNIIFFYILVHKEYYKYFVFAHSKLISLIIGTHFFTDIKFSVQEREVPKDLTRYQVSGITFSKDGKEYTPELESKRIWKFLRFVYLLFVRLGLLYIYEPRLFVGVYLMILSIFIYFRWVLLIYIIVLIYNIMKTIWFCYNPELKDPEASKIYMKVLRTGNETEKGVLFRVDNLYLVYTVFFIYAVQPFHEHTWLNLLNEAKKDVEGKEAIIDAAVERWTSMFHPKDGNIVDACLVWAFMCAEFLFPKERLDAEKTIRKPIFCDRWNRMGTVLIILYWSILMFRILFLNYVAK
jgi:hypothetical protein